VRGGLRRAHLLRAVRVLDVDQAHHPGLGGGVPVTRATWGRSALLYGALVTACVVTLYPILFVLKLALSATGSLSLSANPLPASASLDNFRDFFGSHGPHGEWLFGLYLRNSLIVSVATTLVGMGLAVTAAYALSRFKFPGKEAGMQ